MDKDFELGGRKFKINKINAFKQFHIVRRIGPILSDLLVVLKDAKDFKDTDKMTEEDKLASLSKLISPIMGGLSKLSDTDADLVLFGLLESIEMQQSAGNWAKVSTPTMLMFQDMELPLLLQLAARAFAFNLSGFFTALPQK